MSNTTATVEYLYLEQHMYRSYSVADSAEHSHVPSAPSASSFLLPLTAFITEGLCTVLSVSLMADMSVWGN